MGSFFTIGLVPVSGFESSTTREMPSHQYKVTTAAEEYKKNAELKREDVQNLQEWVAKESHLPEIPGTSGRRVPFI